nr:tyrosine-type recombinase/integrase [Erwinia amylovora]
MLMPRPERDRQSPHYALNSVKSLWDSAVSKSGIRRRRPYQTRHTCAYWLLSAGANPAFIASQMGHENAEMVYAVYSAWLHALDGDQIEFLNRRIGGVNAPIAPLHVNAAWLSYCF